MTVSVQAARKSALFTIVIPALNEEDSIATLIRSIFHQDYRPVEVIVVDGGSSDGTTRIVTTLAKELSDEAFTVSLKAEKAFRKDGNVAHARNLGISLSRGDQVLLLDADCVLSDRRILAEVNEALDTSMVARFQTRTEPNGWLGSQMALDADAPFFQDNSIVGWAFKRHILERFSFDESLGFGEDMDFIRRLDKAGLGNPPIIGALGLRRFPQNFPELWTQKLWYGRSVTMWIRKHHSNRDFLVLSPLVAAGLFVAQFPAYFILFPLGVALRPAESAFHVMMRRLLRPPCL